VPGPLLWKVLYGNVYAEVFNCISVDMYQNIILSAVSQNEYGYLMIYELDFGGGSV